MTACESSFPHSSSVAVTAEDRRWALLQPLKVAPVLTELVGDIRDLVDQPPPLPVWFHNLTEAYADLPSEFETRRDPALEEQ